MLAPFVILGEGLETPWGPMLFLHGVLIDFRLILGPIVVPCWLHVWSHFSMLFQKAPGALLGRLCSNLATILGSIFDVFWVSLGKVKTVLPLEREHSFRPGRPSKVTLFL